MSFSDEDLKILKEWSDELPKPIIVGLELCDEFYEFDLRDLLARLEAAEVWGKAHQELCQAKQNCDVYEAWRKSKGEL